MPTNHWREGFNPGPQIATATPGREELPMAVRADPRRVKDETLVTMFEAKAARSPYAVAIASTGGTWTYADLHGWSNRLACRLQELGVGVDTLVGICAERSPEMVAAVLAVLKAGGAYVPLDPAYPRERLAFMLKDTQAPVLLTQASLRGLLLPDPAQIILLDDEPHGFTDEPACTPSCAAADRLAYVMYTSGSTGVPKGVAMGQAALVNLIRWQVQQSALEVGARTLQFASLCFDVSFQEVFATWCAGGVLVVIPEALRHDPRGLVSRLTDEAVNRLYLPFVALRQLAESAGDRVEVLGALREVITAGEQLQITPGVAAFFARRPHCTLHNQYGPTESHVVTAFRLTGPPADWPALPPIGRPITGCHIRLLNPQHQPVADGEAGELYIGGACLARGYLNRPELTAQRFVPDPTAAAGSGAQLYRTGDLARLRPDGNLEFLGRLDRQVKIRGFRVELGEIEAVLGRHPAVRAVAVAVHPSERGEKRLVAYLVADPERAPSVEALFRFLRAELPGYMVPSVFMRLDALPLTPSGKIDRTALPSPPERRPALEQVFMAPRTAVERQLAALWEGILEIRPVGVKDTFVELGGASLQAADLLMQVRDRFGKELPVSIALEGLTIERLAALISAPGRRASEAALVPIQPLGHRPPLFFVHAIAGEVHSYAPLARRLAAEQPFYGLQVPTVDGMLKRFMSIEAMADHYVNELLALRPREPLLLGGFSLGGVVAFEMAQKLHARGHRIGLVAIVDERAPGAASTPRWGPRSSYRLLANVVPWLREELADQTARQLGARACLKVRGALQRLLRPRSSRLEHPAHTALAAWCDVSRLSEDTRALWEAHSLAQFTYLPEVYPGRITLLRARAQPLFGPHEPDLGWGRFAAGGVAIHAIPGSHDSLLKEPRVKTLAEVLQAAATRAAGDI